MLNWKDKQQIDVLSIRDMFYYVYQRLPIKYTTSIYIPFILYIQQNKQQVNSEINKLT